MGKPNNHFPRATRCERCILAHRPCDAKFPSCTNCAIRRSGPLPCVYPEGQPSRSELKRQKMDEANAKQKKLDEQAKNRKEAGITYGFGEGKYGTVPDSWDERFGGKGGFQKMVEEAHLRGGNVGDGGGKSDTAEAEEKQRKKKRRKTNGKGQTPAGQKGADADVSSEEEIDITKNFPPLGDGPPPAAPPHGLAPRAPSLGTPFDPYVNPDWFNRTQPELTLEDIGRNLVNSLNDSLPKHQGGLLHGLPDYSKCDVDALSDTEEGRAEDLAAVLRVFDNKEIQDLFKEWKPKS